MKVKPYWQLRFKLEAIRNLREDIDLPLPRGSKLILEQSDGESDIINGYILFETEIPDRNHAREEGNKIMEDEIEKILDFVVLESPTNLRIFEIDPNPEIANKEDIFRINGPLCDILHVKEPPIEGILLDRYLKDAVRLKQRIEKQNESDIYRITKWFRRGMDKREEDKDKFIMFWISFNVLYGYYAKKNNEERDNAKKNNEERDINVKQINNLLNNFPSKRNKMLDVLVNRHRAEIDELSNASLITLHGKNRSVDLKNALKAQHNREILKKTALCIYAVRNDLFHGGNFTSLISSCTLILQDMIKSITKEIIWKYTKL